MSGNLDLIRGRQVVEYLTNQSGGSVVAGDVVYLDTANDASFTTGTTSGYTGAVGVAFESIASAAQGRVIVAGYCPLVNVNASVTRGNFGKTHTVVKQATDAGATRVSGTFCQWLSGGTTPQAHLFNIPDAALAASLADSGWIAVSFANSWVNWSSGARPCHYRKIGSFVYLKGAAASGTVNATIFTLPAGYRPAQNSVFAIRDGSGNVQALDCNSDGTVVLEAGSNVYVTMDVIRFIADN